MAGTPPRCRPRPGWIAGEAIGTSFTFDRSSSTASAAGHTQRLVFQNALLPVDDSQPVSATDQGICLDKACGLQRNPFVVGANRIIAISGGGGDRDSSSTEVLLSQLVVRALPSEPARDVPGPLPRPGPWPPSAGAGVCGVA